MSTINAKILVLANTSANFTASNATLEEGRFAFETDTELLKMGTGANYTSAVTINPARNRSVSVFVSGRATDGEIVWRDLVTNATAFTIAANSTDCIANATTGATGSPVFQVQKNGANVGNFTWSANGTTGTANFPADVSFVAGDVRQIVANATSDATLANISITIGGEA